MVAGAAVNTVGTVTLRLPFSRSDFSMRSVQLWSWPSVRCGQPTKQSLGAAFRSFHTQG